MSKKNKGSLSQEELGLYGLTEDQVTVILEYQKRLPVLQQDNNKWTDARQLHRELGVKRQYANWIKEALIDVDAIEGVEFLTSKLKSTGGRPKTEYLITTELAKQIAMAAGAKGGRTSAELREKSRLARRYFIYIEQAFDNREQWNIDRSEAARQYVGLTQAIRDNLSELERRKPLGKKDAFTAEADLLNHIVLGCTAYQWKTSHGFGRHENIRDRLPTEVLEIYHQLEVYDAFMIRSLKLFDYDKRKEALQNEYSRIAPAAKISA